MDDIVTKSATNGRGRPFPKGNGGRPPGARNKTTLVAEALLRGEEEELVRKAIEMAKAGDGPMLKFLLERVLPKERSIAIDLPVGGGAVHAVNALGTILDAVAAGQIAPSEATALQSLIIARARIISEAELMSRLEALETRQKEVQNALECLQKQR